MNANGNSVAYALLTITSRFNQVLRAAVEILKGRISLYPPAVRRLEAEFAKMVGTEYGLMFTNATSGLEAALFSLGVKKNTKVGTVGYVIPSSYCSATALGAELTFIDIDEQTLNINVDQLVSKSGDDIDVLIVVHFYGNPCNMKRIMKWAEANGVW
ncbi:MAG: DegT/DnrJ/EryC1/StrS family aminotransferase, partial [Alphaproteobacteria bacterium]|nr:DegT/DnrJ/EryC1/StrS family aminotransferase [Alphaproteobacteria bacterium]